MLGSSLVDRRPLPLDAREKQVVMLAGQGYSTANIAYVLGAATFMFWPNTPTAPEATFELVASPWTPYPSRLSLTPRTPEPVPKLEVAWP